MHYPDNNESMRERPGQSPGEGEIEYAADDTQPGREESEAVAAAGSKNNAAGTDSNTAAAQDDRYLRLMADFDNFRKRAQRDIESGRSAGVRALALDILPALDALDRGLESAGPSATQEWLDGMAALRSMLLDALRRHGVTPMEAIGQPFDPNLHEAMAVVNTPDLPPDHVYDVVLSGYLIGDEVLRPAHVRVTQ